MNLQSLSLGLMMEGDHASLSTSLQLDGGYLVDAVTAARHQLHPQAGLAIQKLQAGLEVGAWVTCMKQELGLQDGNITEIMMFLNDTGGLQVRRQPRSTLAAALVRLRMVLSGVPPVWLGRRYPSHMLGLGWAVVAAVSPVVLAIVPVGLFWYGAGKSAGQVLSLAVIFILTIVISTVAHEYIHALTAHRLGKPTVVVRRGLRIAVLHATLPAKSEITSALAGPVVGILVAVMFCTVVANILHLHTVLLIGYIVGVFHAISLLPMYGDGQAIVKVIKEARATA